MNIMKFVHQIDDLFTPADCLILIEKANKKGWKLVDNGIAVYDRAVIIDDKLATDLFEKIRSYLPPVFLKQTIVGLNNHFRFSKYAPGGCFKIHADGINADDKGNRAVMTLNIFLNEVEEGGGTIFYKDKDGGLEVKLDVRPKPGRGALFYNQIFHEGEIVKKGYKYLIRTDVMASIL